MSDIDSMSDLAVIMQFFPELKRSELLELSAEDKAELAKQAREALALKDVKGTKAA